MFKSYIQAMHLREIEQKFEQTALARSVGGFFGEFWSFAAKGNIFDLAIGVVVGNAFSAVVNSLVNDIITPFITFGSNDVNLANLQYTIKPAVVSNGATTTPGVVLNYGHFIQISINFFIVALSIFIFVKLFSKIRQHFERKEEAQEKAAPPDPISTQEKLLCEIRDLLKEEVEHTRPDHLHKS